MKRKEQFMDYMSSLYDNLEFELKNENIIKILKNKMTTTELDTHKSYSDRVYLVSFVLNYGEYESVKEWLDNDK